MRDDFYEQFGLKKFATIEEVEVVYRKLVLIHHPDRGGDEFKMKIINRIHHVLTKEKNKYDRELKSRLHPGIRISNGWGFTVVVRSAWATSNNNTTTGSTGAGWGYNG